MERDYIVDEVREIRCEIENKCSNDREKYITYLHEIEAQNKERLVCRGPVAALSHSKVAEERVDYE